MDEPEIRVTVKVTLVSKDGFYTVSEFAPEFWEKYRESAVLIAKADHQEERERRPDELIEREGCTMTYTPKDRVAVDKSPYNGWSEVDNAMRVAIVIGDPPEHIRAAGDAIGEVHRDPIASANLLRLIADEMERRANER